MSDDSPERFPNQIAVIHSHLTDREKTDQWWSVVDKKKKLLIGARSALFCPMPDLGVIVVDEEHETSFKQEEKLKYNARDAAVVKAKICNAPYPSDRPHPVLKLGKIHKKEIHSHFHEEPSSLTPLSQRSTSSTQEKIEILPTNFLTGFQTAFLKN